MVHDTVDTEPGRMMWKGHITANARYNRRGKVWIPLVYNKFKKDKGYLDPRGTQCRQIMADDVPLTVVHDTVNTEQGTMFFC